MRKLYEINADIEQMIEKITDPETGEISNTEDLDGLFLEREQKIESVILYRKDVLAEMTAIGAELDALGKRYERLGKTAEGLKEYIAKALDGQPFKTAKCEVTHRKSEVVEVDDEFVKWAMETFTLEVITHKENDVPNKTVIKRMLKAGTELPHCRLVEKDNITIK